MIAQRGFTYLGLLFVVAFLGLMLAAVGEVWHTALQREREAELLFVGRQYARAIASYRAATPGDIKHGPRRLADLLEDRRGTKLQRHLRRLWPDPFTGQADWGLVKSGEFIDGVYSTHPGEPRKRAGFRPEEEEFAGAASYRDWRFVAGQAPSPAADPAAGVAPTGAAP